MPLIKSKSPKAFEHNVKVEMEANPSPKDRKRNLAIAYSIKRKAKKAAGGSVESGSRDMNMAEGGETKKSHFPKGGEDYSGGQRRGPQGYPKYQEQAQNEKGVHTPVSGVTAFPGRKGTSEAGSLTKDRYAGKPTFDAGPDHPAKKEHRRIIEESRKIKPKLQGLYDGGMVHEDENSQEMISKNRGNKPSKNDNWLDQPTVAQAQKNNGRAVLPIARPKMVPSDAFSTRLYNKEGMLEESAKPGPYGEQPEKDMDEEGPDRQGPKVPDMQDEHSTKAKPYAKGGEIEESDKHSSINKYEDDLLDLPPSEDEGDEMAMSHNEMDADGHGDDVPDMEDEHSTGRKPYAGGGKISDFHEDMDEEMNPAHDKHSPDDSEDQPDEEEHEEHHNSVAAAIMAKKDRKALQMSDSDIDEMMHLYEGGEINEHSGKILSHDSIDSDDSDMADLSRNHDEDANEEDQLSFNALRKENYNDSNLHVMNPEDSAQHGDDEEMDSENRHDMISKIRARMKNKQF